MIIRVNGYDGATFAIFLIFWYFEGQTLPFGSGFLRMKSGRVFEDEIGSSWVLFTALLGIIVIPGILKTATAIFFNYAKVPKAHT